MLGPGDIVVDGGNSRYTEDGPHAELLAGRGIGFVDAGVSGGIWGLTEGYGLMVGGDDDVARLMPIFDALRPAGEVADGFVHAGPVGAGHYAKMVHNGIEYGLMMAYAEGYELLAAEPLITDTQAVIQAWTNGTGGSVMAAATVGQKRSKRIPVSPTSPITPRIPARAGGRSKRLSTIGCRPGDRRVAVRPFASRQNSRPR